MTRKPATIKEIARRLNVSVSTVSRALHDHPSIGAITKQHVRDLATALNYQPNQAAISFKQGKTFTIGVILPNLGEEFFSMAVNAIEDVATENNYTVLIGQSRDVLQREIHLTETMQRHRVDGLIVSLSKNSNRFEHFQRLKNAGIPVVFFDRVPDLRDAYRVSCDLRKAAEELVSFLISQGQRKIAFIKGPDEMLPSMERLRGYQRGLHANHIPIDESYIVQSDLTRESTHAAMQSLLSLTDPPGAVISFNDYVALDAMQYAKQAGLKINTDIHFVSFANLPITTYLADRPLASVEQFPYRQAEQAMELLLKLIGGEVPDTASRQILLEGEVVVRSC